MYIFNQLLENICDTFIQKLVGGLIAYLCTTRIYTVISWQFFQDCGACCLYLVSLCILGGQFIIFWIDLQKIIFACIKGDNSLYSSNHIVIYIFDYRWLDIDMIFPTLCWQPDSSSALLTTNRSLWITLLAVCMLIPETPTYNVGWVTKFTSVKILLCCVTLGQHAPLWKINWMMMMIYLKTITNH